MYRLNAFLCIMKELIDEICNILGVDVAEVMSRKRSKQLDAARNFIFYIAHCNFGYSVGELSRMTGRTRRAVFNSIAKTRIWLQYIKETKATYNLIITNITQKG